MTKPLPHAGRCQVCGCTDADCSQCIEAAGEPCYWVAPNLCSRCAGDDLASTFDHRTEN